MAGPCVRAKRRESGRVGSAFAAAAGRRALGVGDGARRVVPVRGGVLACRSCLPGGQLGRSYPTPASGESGPAGLFIFGCGFVPVLVSKEREDDVPVPSQGFISRWCVLTLLISSPPSVSSSVFLEISINIDHFLKKYICFGKV